MDAPKCLSERRCLAFAVLSLLLFSLPFADAQVNTAATALSQLSASFSGGKAVQQIEITGVATWTTGSLEDSGSVTMNASTDGSSQTQLSLSSSGQRTEIQSGSGQGARCQWTNADGVAHQVDPENCLRPTLWFLPAFSLQPRLLPTYLNIADLGSGPVGSGETTYRHLQSQFVLGTLPAYLKKNVQQRSTMDLGLDPTSFLPAVLAYSVHPDNGSQTSTAIEIHYSNYQAVNGVQIPFLIERYVNGSLQLSIAVTTAQVN